MAATPKYKEMLIGHTRNGRSLGAPITTPSTLTIMLRMFHSAIEEAKGVWELASRKNFAITFQKVPENTPLQTSLESFNV